MLLQRNESSEHGDAAYLVAGKVYPVYAVLLDSSVQYLVSEEKAFSFPFFVSAESVNLVDSTLPSLMHFSPALPSTEECSSRAPMIGFLEIVADRFFYQHLVDGEESAARVWKEVQAAIAGREGS